MRTIGLFWAPRDARAAQRLPSGCAGQVAQGRAAGPGVLDPAGHAAVLAARLGPTLSLDRVKLSRRYVLTQAVKSEAPTNREAEPIGRGPGPRADPG
jgi:hypothetical protein